MIAVTDIDHLRTLIKGGVKKFRINLNFGAFSVKRITLSKDDKFNIVNEIDNSKQSLTEEELFDTNKTLIGRALLVGALYTL